VSNRKRYTARTATHAVYSPATEVIAISIALMVITPLIALVSRIGG
jgi:hypothetical protein